MVSASLHIIRATREKEKMQVIINGIEYVPKAEAEKEVEVTENFDLNTYFNLRKLERDKSSNTIFTAKQSKKCGFHGNTFLMVRASGEYAGKAFFVDDIDYKWELKPEPLRDVINLVPTDEYGCHLNLKPLRLGKGRYPIFTKSELQSAGFAGGYEMQVRGYGDFKNKGFYLSTGGVNWKLVKDSENILCLVPTKKG